MSTYGFAAMLAARSVAVVGARERAGSVGRAVLANLRAGGFAGPAWPVNPSHAALDAEPCYPALDVLPGKPDLVLIATPPGTVPEIVEAAGRAGAAAAVILSTDLGRSDAEPIGAARRAARAHGLRLLGPDCIGLSVPANKLNATLFAAPPLPGDLALISQSGTVASAITAWAHPRNVGFSGVLTLGRSIDVDVADCLDHFAADIGTRAILLSLHRIADARKFLSAARAAARIKPVVVLHTGRREPPETHTGALARPDAVYEAAFRRAGLLSVDSLDALFAAAETLRRQRPFPGRRLMILANGRGIGALAADRLADKGGQAAAPPPDLVAAFDPARRADAGNPLDLGIDAAPDAYAAALTALMADRGNDAILTLHVPTARAGSRETAQAIADTVGKARREGRRRPVFSVSAGEDEMASAAYARAGIPLFATDAEAVDGVLHLVRYREAQDDLMRTPPSLPRDFEPDVAAARAVIARALGENRAWLDPPAVEALLSAYRIPLLPCTLAPDADAAADAAWPLIARGEPVALKLVSPDIVHKSDVGGVRLGLTSEADVRAAAARMLARARAARPEARLTGFAVQAMAPRGTRRELIAGLASDPVFGPVVVFGRGGTAVEVVDDRALALPPLDLSLATDLIGRTRVARRLAAYRDVPAADLHAIALVLVKLAQMAVDLPDLHELDINPLLADADGVLGLDARVRVTPYHPHARHSGAAQRNPDPKGRAEGGQPTTGDDGDQLAPASALNVDCPLPACPSGSGFSPPASPGMTAGEEAAAPTQPMFHVKPFLSRLAIRPYPVEWERTMTLRGRPILVRPVRPEDEALYAAFFRHVSADDIRLRFFAPVKDFSHAFLARLTQLDYARAIAFVALDVGTDDLEQKMLGAVRLHADANHESGEFAILVRSDIKGYGLGYALMRMMIEWARAEGIERIEGTVLAENRAMLAVCRRLSFEAHADHEDPSVTKINLSL